VNEEHREISGAYLKIRRLPGGAMNPGIMDLKYNINQSATAQLVVPNEVLPSLFNIIGWVDKTLLAIALLVTLLSALFLLVSLLSALRERRRDLALMRSLGATRRVAPDSPTRVPRLACQAVRYFGQHGLTSNPWHPAERSATGSWRSGRKPSAWRRA